MNIYSTSPYQGIVTLNIAYWSNVEGYFKPPTLYDAYTFALQELAELSDVLLRNANGGYSRENEREQGSFEQRVQHELEDSVAMHFAIWYAATGKTGRLPKDSVGGNLSLPFPIENGYGAYARGVGAEALLNILQTNAAYASTLTRIMQDQTNSVEMANALMLTNIPLLHDLASLIYSKTYLKERGNDDDLLNKMLIHFFERKIEKFGDKNEQTD